MDLKEDDRKKPGTDREQAHRGSLQYKRSRKHPEKKTREAIRRQLQYLRRDLSSIGLMLGSGLQLSSRWQTRLKCRSFDAYNEAAKLQKPSSGTVNAKDIIHSVFRQIRSTETGTI